jgi:C-terminal processing protease CtpA/Prc
VLDSPLERALSDEVGEPIDGLLGYSFLRRFRIAIDYPHRVLWFEPVPHTEDERPYEYSHVGLQIERRDGALTVVGVASGSPADRAGVRRGDEIAGIDHTPAAELDVIRATRLLEGPPGSSVTLRVQRDGEERVFRLVRRKLL